MKGSRQRGIALRKLFVVIPMLGVLAGAVAWLASTREVPLGTSTTPHLDVAGVEPPPEAPQAQSDGAGAVPVGIETAKAQMRQIVEALELQRINTGRLPETLQELRDPKGGDLVNQKEPVDAWGNTYRYRRISKRNYELLCFGADGREGGDGANADFSKADVIR